MTSRFKAFLALCAASFTLGAYAQAPDRARMSAQAEAMTRLAKMDGVWRGPAWTLQRDGTKRHIVQTERIGPFLQGSVKVLEGRGYGEGGAVAFNALGIVSYDPAKKSYSLRSYALGHSGDFDLIPTDDGYEWQIPAGPGSIIKYKAAIKGDTLHEVGHHIAPGREPIHIFEMTLKRVGDTDWPAGNPVSPR